MARSELVTSMTRSIIFDGKAVLADSSYPPEAWIVSADGRHEINKTVRELKAHVGLVYRGVDIRSQSIMRVPWQLRQGDNVLWYSEDDAVPEKYAWLEDLPDYIGLSEACLCLTSQAFVYKQRNRATVRGLQWFSPLSVAPEWDETAGLRRFERRLSSRVDYYQPDDIIYIWRRDPLHETMPDVAPAQAAMASANVLYSIDQFVTGFFQRGAIKAMLLQVPQNTPQGERDKVKSWWQRFFNGVTDAWQTNVVSTEVKPVMVGEGLESLSNDTLTTERRNDVATTLGIPHSILFSNSANYATASQDERNFYTMTILPDARLIQKQLNQQLFRPLGLQLRFMPQEMDVFQEDEAARAQSFATYVNAGMKQSIAAEILGVELPDGIEYADLDPEPPPPVIVQQAPPDQSQPQPAQDEPPVADDAQVQADATKAVEVATFKRWLKKRPKADPVEFKSAILTDDEKLDIAIEVRGEVALEEGFFTHKALTLQLDPDDDEAERTERMAVERRMERELRAELARVAAELYPADSDPENAAVEAARAAKAVTGERMRDVLSRALQDSADLGVSVAVRQFDNVGFGFDYTLANTAARDWALRHTDTLLQQLGTTTQTIVGQAVGRWVNNGEPLQKLVNDLQPAFGRQRARVIAATEVTRAYAEGTKQAYKESGVVKKLVWQTANDERRCVFCSGLQGKVVGIEQSFDEALPAHLRERIKPFTAPPSHIGCRCWLVAQIDEPKRQRKPKEPKPVEPVATPTPVSPYAGTDLFTLLQERVKPDAFGAIRYSDIRAEVERYVAENQAPGTTGAFHYMTTPEQFSAFRLGGQTLYYTDATREAAIESMARIMQQLLPTGQGLPDTLLQATREVYFTQQRRFGGAWLGGAESAATAEAGTVVVYGGRPADVGIYTHEMGHNLALSVYGTEIPRYGSAYRRIIDNGRELAVSQYGATSEMEDFAEAVRFYFEAPSTMQQQHPQRYAVIDKILKTGAE